MKTGRSAITGSEMKERVRLRQSGADLKPPQAAVVKSGGDEGGKVETGFLIEQASASPLVRC
jgi:hypothetical protein